MLLDGPFLFVQVLNSLQLAMLLFLLSIGLSVVFGLMDYLNLAHGTAYAFGAYAGFTTVGLLGSFWWALAIAPIVAMLAGALIYLLLLRRTQSAGHLVQVLITLGILYAGYDLVRLAYGNVPLGIDEPAAFSGSVTVFGQTYPAYRFFVIGIGLAVLAVLYIIVERTRLGAIVRGGVDDKLTVQTLGIDIERVFFWVFCIGTWLAGLAGVVAAPIFGVYPGMEISVLILMLIVVVVGGAGTLIGTVVGSLLIGFADTFGKVLLPQFSMFLIYFLMAVVLLLKPAGLVALKRGPAA